MKKVACIVLVLLMVAGCSGNSQSGSSEETKSEEVYTVCKTEMSQGKDLFGTVEYKVIPETNEETSPIKQLDMRIIVTSDVILTEEQKAEAEMGWTEILKDKKNVDYSIVIDDYQIIINLTLDVANGLPDGVPEGLRIPTGVMGLEGHVYEDIIVMLEHDGNVCINFPWGE